MKKVFTDVSHVAHLWANQLQDEARNSGNFYFNGDTIYSYGSHFPIAKHVTNDKGENGVLFTTRTYSNTTAKHISVVRHAANHLNLIHCYLPKYSEINHVTTFNAWTSEIESIAQNLVKARKPEKYLNLIDQEFNQATKYAQFFGLELPQTLIAAHSITSGADYLAFADIKEQARIKDEKKAAKDLKAKIKTDLAKWRKFELHTLYNRDGFDYLRYNTAKNIIETSQGVDIEIQAAFLFHAHIIKTIKSGGCTDCNMKFIRYNVTAINKDFIQVGCHKIATKEIEVIAKQLNW